MAISFRSLSSSSQAGTTSVLFRQPATIESGDFLAWFTTTKYPTARPEVPTGYTELLSETGGAGSPGADSGDVTAGVDYRIGDGTEDAATETRSASGGNSVTSRSIAMQRSAGTGWLIASTHGAQSTASGSWSVTSVGSIAVAADDYILIGVHKNGDADPTHTSPALSASGITFGTVETHVSSVGSTQGDDVGYALYGFPVSSGSGTVALTFTLSLSGSAANTAGVITFIRLREDGVGPTPIGFSGTIPTLTGEQGSAFSEDLAGYFTGSETPFTYTMTGTLPAGLSRSGAVISGTPTVGGTFGPFVLTGTDQDSDTADSNSFYIALSSNPSADAGYYAVAQTSNGAMEHTTASHSFHHDGSWWQMLRVGTDWSLYEESGNVPGSAGDTVDWTATAHLASVHTGVLCTVALDAPRNRAFVLGFGESASSVQFRVLTYSAGTWSVAQSFNLVGTGGVGLGTTSTFSNHSKLSIGVDSNGVPMVVAGNKGTGASASNGCHIAWPNDAATLGGAWTSTLIETAQDSEGDDSGCFAGVFSQGGTNYVAVVYTDHPNERVRLAYHEVETTLSDYSTGWTAVTVDSTMSVDNHLWARTIEFEGDQVIVTAAKAGDGALAGRIHVFTSQLGASLTWTHKRHRVTNGPGDAGALAESPSRPQCVLDSANGRVYVLYHSRDSHPYGWIGYKVADLSELLAASTDTSVFDTNVARNSTVLINDESLDAAWNVKAPAHHVTPAMLYAPVTAAVAASSSAGDSIWWASFEVSAPPITVVVTLDNTTSSVQGTTTILATISNTLASTTSSITGTTTIAGTIVGSLADTTSDISGSVGAGVSGVVDSFLGDATASISGTTTVLSSIAATLENTVSSITTTTTIVGTISTTLDDVTSSISGVSGDAPDTSTWRTLTNMGQ